MDKDTDRDTDRDTDKDPDMATETDVDIKFSYFFYISLRHYCCYSAFGNSAKNL